MAIEWRTARYPDREFIRFTGKREATQRIDDFLGPQEGRTRLVGLTDYTGWRPPAIVMERVRGRMDRMAEGGDPGPLFGENMIVQRRRDGMALSVRALLDQPEIPDLGAHPHVEQSHAWLWKKFPVRSGGLWLCRFIEGTRIVTKHGFHGVGWKGAAEDVFVTEGGMDQQERMATAFVESCRNGDLRQVELIECISNRRIWTPSQGWHPYGGAQHFHMHFGVAGGQACSP